MTYLAALIVGLAAGTHIATWGMYKDAPHEGFRRFKRSVIIAAIIAPLIVTAVPREWLSAGGLALLFGVTYVCERGTTEFYKVFIRNEDQSKYFIPMQFHVFGRVMPPGPRRAAVAAAYAAVFILTGAAVFLVNDAKFAAPRWAVFGAIGSSLGWLIAFGGAFKDAPIEGFEWLKFFRSPVIAGAYAALLSPFTNSYLLAALGGAGYSIATIETYKTLFFPNRPRGKFAGKPVLFPENLERRKKFVPLYAAIWAAVIATFALGYLVI
ncbi:MAG: hypothetical protein ACE148_17745 [Vicinamibacterales bacterium]